MHLISHLKATKKLQKFSKLISCIDSMLAKLNDYWVHSIDVAKVCMLLDPRQKAELIESNSGKKDSIGKLKAIFKVYEPNVAVTSQPIETKKPKSIMERVFHLSFSTEAAVENEMKRYFNEPRISHDEHKNILQWWHENKINYPVLSTIARDYLAIMPSSVLSERSFSTGGQTLTKERCNLHPETARELMCVKSWSKKKNKN